VPCPDNAGEGAKLHAPEVQSAVPFCVAEPVTEIETVPLSPAAAPQEPATAATDAPVV
jgi:hypothetical protein